MKYLLFIIVFVFVGFAAVAQEETNLQDTVYLKNENVITGTVLNPSSEGSIQVRTNGNSIIYVSPTQIDHIALHTHYVAGKNQQSPDQVIQRKLIDDQFNFSVWGGLAAPGGSFGSSIGQYPGFAKTGWMMQAATWVRVKDQLFWSTQFAFVRNAFNDTEFSLAQEAQSGLNVYNFYASNWDAVHINTGITWSTELNNDFQLFLQYSSQPSNCSPWTKDDEIIAMHSHAQVFAFMPEYTRRTKPLYKLSFFHSNFDLFRPRICSVARSVECPQQQCMC